MPFACRICVFLSGLFLGVKNCLSHAQIGLLWGSQKARATPRWSPLGVKFKISNKHPRLFHMGFPPHPSPSSLLFFSPILKWRACSQAKVLLGQPARQNTFTMLQRLKLY